jgi:DNA-binding transcriptional ArsR family regulator
MRRVRTPIEKGSIVKNLPKFKRADVLLHSQQLQLALLAELNEGPRTSRQLVAKFGLSRGIVYAALNKLYEASMVDSETDRRRDEDGIVIGATWMLSGRPLPARAAVVKARPVETPKPFTIPRDPWIWALHGAQP